jgi:ketosteroid isomerase-like protein
MRSTRDVVDAYYRTVNSGAWQEWLELFADDIKMDEQLAGPVSGIETLRGAISGLEKGYSKFQMHPIHVVVDGDKAAVVWHCDAANASGVPINAMGANYYEVKNGLITYFANFHDTVPFRPFTEQKL